jgi:VIT1/CCC1 family predicted Fe2+/Mn2+ transporter
MRPRADLEEWGERNPTCPWLESNYNSSIITFISIPLLPFFLLPLFISFILSAALHILVAFFLYVTFHRLTD